MVTPEQCRAARALLDWTQADLAERAGVSRSTVRGFENGRHELHRGSAAVIRAALEAAGVVMIDPDEQGPGVRLRRPRSAADQAGAADPGPGAHPETVK